MRNTTPGSIRPKLHACLALLLLLALGLGSFRFPPVASAATDLVIYDDALAPGWQNWSYGNTVDLANTAPAVGGTSIAATPTGAYGALALRAPSPVALADYSALRFEVYGAAGGNQLQVYTTTTDTSPAGPSAPFDATAGTWTTVTIPFTQLGNPTTAQIVAIQDRSGAAQPTFYVDNMRLVGDGSELPPPPPAHPYRQLRDVDVFTGKPNGSYVFSGGGLSIAAEGGLIPLDTAQSYNSQPSYRLEVTGPTGYWGAGIARGWLTYSLRNYRTYGALEFNIKGAAGGESINLALYDLRYERPGGGPLAVEVSAALGRYVTISREWQHVKIPLREIFPADSPFDLNAAQVVQFRGLSAGTVWVNDIRFTAPVDEPSFPAIKVNQVGYLSKAEKYALVSGFPEELSADVGTPFSVRAADGSSAFAGTLQLVSANDTVVSGEKVLLADFSALTTPSSYTLRVDAPGISDSPPFSIGDSVYSPLLTDAMRFFYLQRSGIALDAAHAGAFARGEGHPQDRQAILRSSTVGTNPVTRTLDVSGGWYDAGDYEPPLLR